jgi:hypothetical protein
MPDADGDIEMKRQREAMEEDEQGDGQQPAEAAQGGAAQQGGQVSIRLAQDAWAPLCM